jgi:hypothetical protein
MEDGKLVCKIDASRVAAPGNHVVGTPSLIQRFSDLLLSEAVRHGADSIRIFLSPEDRIVIEYHVDGQWRAVDSPPRHVLEPLLAHLLIAQEYGQNGIPLVTDKATAAARLEIKSAALTISVPNHEAKA